MPKHKLVALLPMKANSERVPGKNFKPLAGKPLFKWILDTLLSVELIDKVIINTDACSFLETQNIGENQRVLLRERKEALCGDLVSMNLILQDDIGAVDSDLYLMTHTTNPFISKETIESAIHDYYRNSSNNDSLFSVNKVQTRFYHEDLSAVNHDPNRLIRTQDLETWYEENSCLYLFTKQSFEKKMARIGEKPISYITPPLESIDIDEPEDWTMAEALALYNQTKRS